MPDLPMPRSFCLHLLKELPKPPSALSKDDVLHLIRFLMTVYQLNENENNIFTWLLQHEWLAPAEHLPKRASGEYVYFHRTEAGQQAIEGNLLERRPRWV